MKSEIFCIFFSKTGRQKYSASILGDPMPSCFFSVTSLFQETYKFLKNRLLHHRVFFVKQYTSLIYVEEVILSI